MAVALLVAPQLLGGVFPWSVAVICVLVAVAGVQTSRHVEILGHGRQSAKLLDWMMLIALAWTIRKDGVISIPKASDPEHVRMNAAALEIQLTPEDLADLDTDHPPPDRETGLETL